MHFVKFNYNLRLVRLLFQQLGCTSWIKDLIILELYEGNEFMQRKFYVN